MLCGGTVVCVVSASVQCGREVGTCALGCSRPPSLGRAWSCPLGHLSIRGSLSLSKYGALCGGAGFCGVDVVQVIPKQSLSLVQGASVPEELSSTRTSSRKKGTTFLVRVLPVARIFYIEWRVISLLPAKLTILMLLSFNIKQCLYNFLY